MDAAERDELIAVFLAGRDVPCPRCGYNLRGLERARCPECERPLTLRVEPAEPPRGVFVAGLTGLVGGAAFSVAMGVHAVAADVWGGSAAGAVMAVWPAPLTCVCQAALAAAWIHWAGSMGRLPLVARRGLVAACWVVSIAVGWLALWGVFLDRV